MGSRRVACIEMRSHRRGVHERTAWLVPLRGADLDQAAFGIAVAGPAVPVATPGIVADAELVGVARSHRVPVELQEPGRPGGEVGLLAETPRGVVHEDVPGGPIEHLAVRLAPRIGPP